MTSLDESTVETGVPRVLQPGLVADAIVYPRPGHAWRGNGPQQSVTLDTPGAEMDHNNQSLWIEGTSNNDNEKSVHQL